MHCVLVYKFDWPERFLYGIFEIGHLGNVVRGYNVCWTYHLLHLTAETLLDIRICSKLVQGPHLGEGWLQQAGGGQQAKSLQHKTTLTNKPVKFDLSHVSWIYMPVNKCLQLDTQHWSSYRINIQPLSITKYTCSNCWRNSVIYVYRPDLLGPGHQRACQPHCLSSAKKTAL